MVTDSSVQTEHCGSASLNAASPEGTSNDCPQMTRTPNFLKRKKQKKQALLALNTTV